MVVKNSLTIRKKLIALALTGVSLVVGAGWAGYAGIAALDDAMDDISEDLQAVQHTTAMDNFHDALRGDVLEAMHVSQGGSVADRSEVVAEVADHARKLVEEAERAGRAMNEAEVRAKHAPIAARVERYGQLARSVVDLAFADRGAAIGQLPEFDRQFKALEVEIAALSEAVAAASRDSQRRGDERVGVANRTLLGVTIGRPSCSSPSRSRSPRASSAGCSTRSGWRSRSPAATCRGPSWWTGRTRSPPCRPPCAT